MRTRFPTRMTLCAVLAMLAVAAVAATAAPEVTVTATGDISIRWSPGPDRNVRVGVDGPDGRPGVPRRSVLIAARRGHVPEIESGLRGVSTVPTGNVAVVQPDALDSAVEGIPHRVDRPSRSPAFPDRHVEVRFAGRLRGVDVYRLTLYPLARTSASDDLTAVSEFDIRLRFAPEPYATESNSSTPYADPYGASLRGAAFGSSRVVPSRAGSGPAPDAGIESGPMTPVRIATSERGVHVVTHDDLVAAGVDVVTVDPRNLSLFRDGVELPCRIEGESDGSLDPGDALEFFADTIDRARREFNTHDVFWLRESPSPGARVGERAAPPSGAAIQTVYTDIDRGEEDHLFWQLLPGGAEYDHYLWERVTSPATRTYALDLVNVDPDPGATGRVTLTVHGRSSTAQDPDHHVIVSLNGTAIDDFTFNGDVFVQRSIDVPADLFRDGANDLIVESPGDTAAAIDSWYMNWFELTYRDRLIAESDRLCFDLDEPAAREVRIDGFGSIDLRLYDVTDPAAPVLVTVWATAAGGVGTELSFQEAVVAPRRYCATTAVARIAPVSVSADVPTSWRSAVHRADHVIVYHDKFAAQVATLANHRRASGLDVVEIEIQDVFDEFSNGYKDPVAIRDLMEYAYHEWQGPPPAYLLLFGDADQDSRDIYGNGDDDYVPTALYYSSDYGTIPQDHGFACVDGDDLLPDLYVGRVAVRTTTDANTVVQRIVDHETAPPAGAWNHRVLFVADDQDEFEIQQDHFADLLPAGYESPRVYLSQYPTTADARDAIRSEIDTGAIMTKYVGHGDPNRWAEETMWHTNDVVSLSNGDRAPLAVALTCVNGFFSFPTIAYALSEELMRHADRGALAVWAPTGLGYTDDYTFVGDELFRELFDTGNAVVGSAVTNAKVRAYATYGISPDLYQTLTLLGDPATVLAVDRDADGLTDADEIALGLDPLDGDVDDDGMPDGTDPDPRSVDADGDALPDGLEAGVVVPGPYTDPARFVGDTDPASTTDPAAWDTDGGGAPDGAEDRDVNGAFGSGETDPVAGQGADDPVCAAPPIPELDGPGVSGLRIGREGDDLRVAWTPITDARPCMLYRVYVAESAPTRDCFCHYRLVATTTDAEFLHEGAATGADATLEYLVVGFHPADGEGGLGHYGR